VNGPQAPLGVPDPSAGFGGAGSTPPGKRSARWVGRHLLTLSIVFAYAAMLLVVAWSRSFEAAYVPMAAAFLLVAGVGLHRVRGAVRRSGGARGPVAFAASMIVAVALAVASATVVSHRLGQLGTHWDAELATQRAALVSRLERRTALELERGRQAVRRAAAAVGAGEGGDLFAAVAGIRGRTGVDALAVFSEAGELVAWAGDHRGPIPSEIRVASEPVRYIERPLFSYLYFSEAVEGRGGRVVAAILFQTGLDSESAGPLGVAERFAARTGSRPYFAAGPGIEGGWPWVVGSDTVAYVRFEPITQAEARIVIGNAGRRIILPLAGLAVVFGTVAWHRSRPRRGLRAATPLLASMAILGIAPVGPALGAERLFSPALFLLPVPPELSLGRMLLLLLPLAALAAGTRPAVVNGGRGRVAVLLGALAVALGFPGGLSLLVDGAAPSLLKGGAPYWGAFQLVLLLVLTLIAGLALPQGGAGEGTPAPPSDGGRNRVTRPILITLGLATSLVLAGIVIVRWQLAQRVDPWVPALWAVPFVFLGMGLVPAVGRPSRLLRWLTAAWLGGTAVLPHLWVTQLAARLDAAERDLATLGLRPDPFLDYLLHQFAADVVRRDARGEDGVAMLYRSWVASGLARGAYPARVSVWGADGRRETDLPLGDIFGTDRSAAPSSRILRDALSRARETGMPVLASPPEAPGATQLLAVPLLGDRVVTVFVPPRRSLDRLTILAPIVGAEPNPTMRLTLTPEVRDRAHPPEAFGWTATEQGWRREAVLRYPDGEYHAHLELRTPPTGVVLARGALLLAMDLGLIVLLWAIGRAGWGDPPGPPGGWATWVGSFRFRVTIALFGFFLVPTVLFGTLAYRAVAGEAARTARVLAERAATQAVAAYAELPGNWRALAGRVGEEILYYHRGELAQSSSPESMALGIFGAWMPPQVFQVLATGEDVSMVDGRGPGRRPYLVAYRRLPAGTLAVPVSLVAGEASVRQRELAHLVLLATLVGAILSLALSLYVGRALSRPIGQLRRASGAVGAGRLRVHLPETGAGEFGQLFASFNRMVRRLRRARTRELRAARVLAWGEMSRQVAHEIKNPLTPIKLSVQHLRRAYADGREDFGEILEANVEQILKEIDRLTEIARAFSRYGAPAESAGPLEAVDLAPVVREALTLYRVGEASVHYWPELPADLPRVRARTGELKEVLLNLLENAYTALEGKGTVVIGAACKDGHVELTVRDDGPGIPPELLNRIFEPHFSTRSSGTGLGLAIVRRLVEDWGGTVTAESELGRGTTIRVRLVVAEEPTYASGS
jgi:signal transduction histidine kinase